MAWGGRRGMHNIDGWNDGVSLWEQGRNDVHHTNERLLQKDMKP